MTANKHGLGRHIPEHIKREIRKRSKFGCVICRHAIYVYEHIDPQFHEASEHDPEKMCLLCGHCHDKVNRGLLSKQTVASRYHDIQKAERVRQPFDEFDLDHSNLVVRLGSSVFRDPKKLIVIDGETILAIEPPEEGSCFPTLSGWLCDRTGQELIRIDRNEWVLDPSVNDLEVSGRQIILRDQSKNIALQIEVQPPDQFWIRELDMVYRNCHIFLANDFLEVGRLQGAVMKYMGVSNLDCGHAEIGVSVGEPEANDHGPVTISIVGGEAIKLCGTGIALAVGAPGLTIGALQTRARFIWNIPQFTSKLGTTDFSV